MLARLIATIAALLFACASPQAQAFVRAERVSTSYTHLAQTATPESALQSKSASDPKTALPARAKAQYSAPGENTSVTHCHVWGNWSQSERFASVPTHYNYFRDYEAGTGRYVQSDPVGLAGGLSTYGYVEQSPLANFDPLGLARGPNGRFLPDPNKDPNAPKWTDTDRRKHWKKHCEDPNSPLTDEQRDEIRKRGYRGPQRLNEDGELETMELSHEPIPIRDGGTETVPRWPADHAAVDPHRHLKKKKCPC